MSETLALNTTPQSENSLKTWWENRRRPLKAWLHMRKLIADKEDTAQVFYIIKYLNGRAIFKDFADFMKSPEGQARFSERRDLIPYLDDHARWEALPAGTVGRAYVDFMQSQGLTAQGLVDEYERFGAKEEFAGLDPDVLWYGDRRRDTHDLLHVLTSYSRDALGEASVLAFSHGQNRGLGVIFIAWVAAMEIKKTAPKGAPVLRSIREGFKIGKAAKKVAREDILALMEEPLDVARERLGITLPKAYHQCHETFRNAGIDPFETLATA